MNPFHVGDLVTQLPKAARKRTIHRISKVEGERVWVDGHNYKHDAIHFQHCVLVTLTSPGEIKR